MAFNQFRSSTPFLKAAIIALIGWSTFYAPLVYADLSVPDLSTMLANFSTSIPQFMQLITAFAYVMGLWFVFKAILGMKAFGEQRSMMSSHQELKGPIVYFMVGSCLLYLPSAVQSGLTTFWTDPNPYGYVTEGATDQWTVMYQDAFLVVQFIGTIAFIRGLVTLSSMGNQQGQPGAFGKGFTYIIAGALCINLNDFLTAINNTLGITGVITG
jgi:hypothetical protein